MPAPPVVKFAINAAARFYDPVVVNFAGTYGSFGENAVFNYGGSLYTFQVNGFNITTIVNPSTYLSTPGAVQCFGSPDGLAWAPFGTSYADTESNPGSSFYQPFCFWQDGPIIYFAYGVNQLATSLDNGVAVVGFDVRSGSWDAPITYDIQNDGYYAAGVYAAVPNASGWLLFLCGTDVASNTRFFTLQFNTTVKSLSAGLAIDGNLPQPNSDYVLGQFQSGNVVYMLFSEGYQTAPYHLQAVNLSSTLGGDLPVSPAVLLVSGFGVQIGPDLIMTAADAGKDLVFLYHDGSTGMWVITPGLDTAFAGQMHFNASPFLALYNGLVLCVYAAGIGVYGDNEYVLRFGYAPVSKFDDPLSWTWVSLFDFSSDPIGGFPLPYQVQNSSIVGSLIGNVLYIKYRVAYTDNGGLGAARESELGFTASFSLPNISSGGAGAAGGAVGGAGQGGGFGTGGFASNAGGRFKCCSSGHDFQGAKRLEVVRQQAKRKEAWPYVHEFPPSGSIPVETIGNIASPVVGVRTAIVTYLVPQGFRFYLVALIRDFAGAVFQPGSALWTVDRDANPLSAQGSFVQGLIQTPVPLGSFTDGRQWALPRAYEFEPLEIVRDTVVNVSVGVGLPNTFTSGFFGYLVPAIVGRNLVLQRS